MLETHRLLLHWRDPYRARRLFFCQREAIETLIYSTEVAPNRFRKQIAEANAKANPGLNRLAAKMATGSGKTTVMGMIIAWQAVNKARRANSKTFSDAFLIVAPGITIRDRLRVLLPSDPENIYEALRLVPTDLLDGVRKARIAVTNYHAFMLRETEQVSKLNRQILGGREGERRFTETDGDMIVRAGKELMGRKNIIVLNDEAHHCYRHKVGDDADADAALTTEERDEAKRNEEAARVWISGIEAFSRKIGVAAVYDLSATPFFLKGSGYPEGTLFPWVVSDFGLLDAIESGIVKVPRLPVLDDSIQGDLPKFRDVYRHVSKGLPKKGRGKQAKMLMDPQNLPHLLLQAPKHSISTTKRFTKVGTQSQNWVAHRCSLWSAIIADAAWHLTTDPARTGFVENLAALSNHCERAMVTFLDHNQFWKGATRFYHADTLPYWRKRKNLPHQLAAVDEASLRELAGLIRTYFHHTEGRGNNCVVEPFRRGELDYFFAYPEDYSQQSIEWVNGEFGRRPHNPAFEVIYVYTQREGSLDVNFRGSYKSIEPLQEMFPTAILKLPELPPDPNDGRIYDLNPLREKAFDFVYDAGSGIQDVAVKKLRLSSKVKKGDRITLEADPIDNLDAVYELLDKVGKCLPLQLYNVTQVELTASVVVDADKPPKAVTIRIAHPNSCSLKYDELDLKLRDMLNASGIEPKEPAEASEAAEAAET